jgi:subtilisin family serine protease
MPRFGPTLVAATVAVLLAAPSASATQEQPVRGSAPATPPAAFSPDRVIVEWAAGASPTERRAAREEAGVDFAGDLGSRRFQLVETEPGQAPREAVRELEADPAVVVAERDGYYGLDSIPNDPLFGQLWGLQNTGLGIDGFEGALAGDDINVISAWTRTVGTPSTIVADIDGGYRFEHPDLANVVWTNPGEIPENGLDDDGDGIVDDVHGADFVGVNTEAPVTDGDPTEDNPLTRGHGVHTAGIIGAQGNNGIGVTGVAQDVSLMPLRVCSRHGSDKEESCPFSALVEAVNYAGAHGARVANISIGGEVGSAALADAIAANPQTLFVIAAGNESADNEVHPQYPCVYNPLGEGKSTVDNVICVAATDQADQLAWFSNWGANTVDLGAPGTQILSVAPYRYVVKDDFEADDFASKWVASGPDGGFARTNEPPLTSFGMSDSPGATPVAGSTRASTSVPVTLAPGYESCAIEIVRSSSGESPFLEVLLDGESELGFGVVNPGRTSHNLGADLSEGGEVAVRVSYTAGSNPTPSSGVWIEEIDLHCIAKPGEADGYRFAEGTSMAAPQVTGAAALLFSLKPSASVTEVRQGLLGSVDPVPSLAGKTTSGGRLDAGAATDLFDSVPPPAPALSATNPSSPSKNNQPRLIGSAQSGTSIDVYANATCSGSPVAGGTAAQLAGPGIAVTVGRETVTEFSARATDMVPLASACSAPISYTENTDLVPPAPPQLTGTDPTSPGASGTPRILGAAEAGSSVSVHAGPACAGPPVATGSAAELGSPGIPVQVAEGVTAVFSATATDAADNTSSCSAPISYTRVKATTDAGGGDGSTAGGPTPTPVCTVPKLAGKTLARAKAALTRAACKLDTVRKPRPRKGKRLPPLVVKSSSPTAGAQPADGEVNLTLRPKPRKSGRT